MLRHLEERCSPFHSDLAFWLAVIDVTLESMTSDSFRPTSNPLCCWILGLSVSCPLFPYLGLGGRSSFMSLRMIGPRPSSSSGLGMPFWVTVMIVSVILQSPFIRGMWLIAPSAWRVPTLRSTSLSAALLWWGLGGHSKFWTVSLFRVGLICALSVGFRLLTLWFWWWSCSQSEWDGPEGLCSSGSPWLLLHEGAFKVVCLGSQVCTSSFSFLNFPVHSLLIWSSLVLVYFLSRSFWFLVRSFIFGPSQKCQLGVARSVAGLVDCICNCLHWVPPCMRFTVKDSQPFFNWILILVCGSYEPSYMYLVSYVLYYWTWVFSIFNL